MVKTGVPQCPCGNVPVGRAREALTLMGFCQQTAECVRMRRHALKAEAKGLLQEQAPVAVPKEQRRTYTPDQKARKTEKNKRRMQRKGFKG